MATWHLGTMGFSYDDWRGVFYPAPMPARNFLGYYSRFFNAVEIDSTFYGAPREETVLRWRNVTPVDFTFCLKAPREITHEARLQGFLAKENMGLFLRRIALLEEKLGVVLFQFPPSFQATATETMADFMKDLPKEFNYAVEFRHLSWFTQKTKEILGNLRVSWASTEYPKLPQDLHLTADQIYIRWIGQHGRFGHHNREQIDITNNLLTWKKQLHNNLSDHHLIYGFFNNDYAGFAPGTCNRFKELINLPGKNFKPPVQKSLF